MRLVPTMAPERRTLLLLLAGCSSEYQVAPQPVDVDPGLVTDCGFSPVAGTKFSRYDCNPVFSSTGEDWASSIGSVGFRAEYVLGHPFYQMWYVGSSDEAGEDWAVGYAVSSDGTHWEPRPENPVYRSQYAYDEDGINGLSVVWDANNAQYMMSYQAVDQVRNSLRLTNGVATSADAVNWNQLETPTMELSEISDDGISWCWTVTTAYINDEVRGFITGDPRPNDANQVCKLYGIRVPNAQTWQPGSTEILPTESAPYDQNGVLAASVVEHDGMFYMFYVGFSRWDEDRQTQSVHAAETHLALATSTDGITWVRHPDNPLDQLSNFPNDGKITSIHAQSVGSRILVWLNDEYEEVGQAVGYFYFEPDIAAHP